jgi:dipeptidyl aminopeptidase/acylaminoacyl peptidase
VWAEQTQGQDLLTVFPALNIAAELYGDFSPVRFATADDPPTLIIHGDQDPLVPIAQGELMRDALVRVGAISELIVVEGAGHGFQNDDADFAVAQSLAWFQRHLQ